ncbi:PEP-CTERM sorting domain-containing protein [Roseiarcus sp.]|uniref:PEP-CTERM sorting domain-containing protein n=1 Tax=Roseiarcus sp. TaxID=1969460 RepID=UPI003C353EC9
MNFRAVLVGALGVALLAGGANASLVNAPVPSNAYIAFDGLDWAWAAPVAADGSFGCCGVDLSYESQFGWRLPTATELTNAPSALQFLFAGANVPLNGTDPVSGAYFDYASSTLDGPAASAVPYFNDVVSQADWCNAPGSACGFGEVPWWGQPGAPTYAESLVVRSVSGVPEPSTWAMMVLGFAGLGFAGHRTRARSNVLAA